MRDGSLLPSSPIPTTDGHETLSDGSQPCAQSDKPTDRVGKRMRQAYHGDSVLQAEVLLESLARSWTRPTPVLRPARASTTLDLYTHHQRELDKRVGDLFADFSPTPAEDDDAEVKGDDGADVV